MPRRKDHCRPARRCNISAASLHPVLQRGHRAVDRRDRLPRVSFLKLAGPGLIVAATGIGSGDVVSATVGGAKYGVVLLWGIALGAFFKFVLSEGIARWQLATGSTVARGLGRTPPRVGEGVLRRLSRVVDRRRERGAHQRHRSRHREPHRRAHLATLGSRRSQPDRLFLRLVRRVRRLRKNDEDARRHHGVQHPVLRR